MSLQHADYESANIHESKGVSTAVADNVYVADGAGSGTWKRAKQRHVVSLNITTQTLADYSDFSTIGGLDFGGLDFGGISF